MPPPKLTTIGPELLRDIRWVIDRVKRMVGGDLRDDERKPPLAPDDYVVLTPEGGIAARDGTTIYGESCAVYTFTGDVTSGELTMSAISGFSLMVYNISNEAVEGGKYVVTSLLKSGVRYVVLESCEAEA
jgi:hypothetical protein